MIGRSCRRLGASPSTTAAVAALGRADFALRQGEVHAIVGDNGADLRRHWSGDCEILGPFGGEGATGGGGCGSAASTVAGRGLRRATQPQFGRSAAGRPAPNGGINFPAEPPEGADVNQSSLRTTGHACSATAGAGEHVGVGPLCGVARLRARRQMWIGPNTHTLLITTTLLTSVAVAVPVRNLPPLLARVRLR
jgi:hypothetical protein